MNYEPNKTKWKVGDLVLQSAERMYSSAKALAIRINDLERPSEALAEEAVEDNSCKN